MRINTILTLISALCFLLPVGAMADPPSNDDCAYADDAGTLTANDSVQLTGTTVDATDDCESDLINEVWVKFTIESCMNITIDYCDDSGNPLSALNYLYSECPCGDSDYADEQHLCSNDSPSLVWNNLDAGTYYYSIGDMTGGDAKAGPYTINITAEECSPPPDNDDCAYADNAGTLTADETVQLSGTTAGATNDCEDLYLPEVWVKFTLTSCMDVTIDFCDETSFRTIASDNLFTECPCGEGTGSSISGSCTNENPSLIWEILEAGTYYYPIWYGGYSDSYIVNITGADCPLPPDNDNCADAIEIGDVTNLEFTTEAATYDGNGTCITDEPNVWFVYTASSTDDVRLSFSGSSFDPEYAIYDGTSCSSLPYEISCSDDTYLDFAVVSGQQYLIEVGGESGDGMLSIGPLPDPPSNDDCENADDGGTLQSDFTIQFTGTTLGATQDCSNNNNPEVWIKFTIPSCMNVTIDFCDDENNVSENEMRLYNDCSFDDYTSASGMSYCENFNPSYIWNNIESGTYYYPILASDGGGPYTVNVTGVDCPVGACCVGDGTTCYDGIQELDCINNYEGTWKGADSECGEQDSETGIYEGCQDEPNTGACCYEEGYSCIDDISEEDCYEGYFGDSWHAGVECGEQDSETGIYEACQEEETGACCYEDGDITACVATDEDACMGQYEGDWMGYGTDCTDSDENEIADICEEPFTGACCYGDGDCIETDEDNCYGQYEGEWKGEGTDCTDADENEIADACEESDTYEYLPGDANMAAEAWPAQTIGGDVTYLVNYFRGLADPCYLDGFYASADATGDCMVVGGDVTYLVNYFRGLADMSYCSNYEPAWPTPSEVPTDAPDGWPNCD